MELYNVMLTTVETIDEVVEGTLVYDIEDVYMALQEISSQLDSLLQYLETSELNSVAALLLILIGFEIMRLVRGWLKGGIHNGGYPH